MKKLLPLVLALFALNSFAQETTCGFDHANPAALIKQTNQNIDFYKQAKSESDTGQVLRIPVVVHVIYKTFNGSPVGKISKQQVASQIDFTNEIYRAQYGTRASGPDHRIEFYLANQLPDGTYFDGILLHDIDSLDISETDKQLYKDYGVRSPSLGISDATLKSAVVLPNQEYYNILIVTEINNSNAGGGIQGFAYFPTTSIVDGVVNVYNAWGVRDGGYYPDGDNANLKSYTDLGGTGVHELGHTLALFHTFQGGSCSESNCNIQGDRVCDTPPTTLSSSCSNAACSGTQQVENYMDYTSQTCKDLLTEGQGERMRLTAINSRANLLEAFNTSHKWRETTVDAQLNLPATLCSTNQAYEMEITNTGDSTLERLTIQYGSSYVNADTLEWVGCLLPNQSETIYLPPTDNATATVGFDILKVNTFDYEFQPDIQTSQVGNIQIVVEFSPDVLGGQNGWTIERNGEVVASRESYPNFASAETFTDTVCVQSGCITFTFTDILGNGICCFNGEGDLNVYVNGNLYAQIPEDFTDVWTISNCGANEIVGYYNFMGEKLDSEPQKGLYIVRYGNNTFEKIFKQ